MNFKRLVFIAIAIILLLAGIPFLIPMGAYLGKIEQVASEKSGMPITIESLHVAVLPSPRVRIGGIVIGKNADVKVVEASAVLDVRTLFDPVPVIARLDVDGVMARKSALDLVGLLKGQSGGPSVVVIRHIQIHNATLDWPGLKLPQVDAEMVMSDTGVPVRASLVSTDGKLKIAAMPKREGYDITLGAEHWIPPVGPALQLDSLKANMQLAGSRLNVPAFSIRLYHGTVDGNATLDWSKLWKLSGKVRVAGLEVGEPAKLLSRTMRVSGRMTGSGTFSASAVKPDELADRATVDFRFDVANGVLYGMDLAKAASLFIKQGQGGGETQFDKLSGTLHAIGKQYDLSDLQVVSGLLAANGGVQISPTRKLDGQVDVELKKGLALVTVPLQISGTVDAPEIMPTKAAVAGAAAGTAVLGPLGTSLGMKAGSALDRLFGGKK